MTRVRRRRAIEARPTLTPDEHRWLKYGDFGGRLNPFADEATERSAWERHRDEITAAHPRGLTPFAAARFDDASGPASPYWRLWEEAQGATS